MDSVVVDPTYRPNPILAKSNDKVKEVVTVPRQRWTPIKINQRRQDSTSDVISHSTL